MTEIAEAYKAYHHAKAAYERKRDEFLANLPKDDVLIDANDYVVQAVVNDRFPEELEALRVAAIQLDVKRQEEEEDRAEEESLTREVIRESHRATTRQLQAQADHYLQRARLDRLMADAMESLGS